MVNVGPLYNGRDRLSSFWHPSKFQRVSRLGFVTAAASLNGSQPNFARCFAVSWAGTLYTMSHKKTEPTYFCMKLREKSTDFNAVFTVRINNERYMCLTDR